MKSHPCLTCGACCSAYRVSFYWTETLPESFNVPTELTERVNSFYAAMKVSQGQRCIALQGEVGQQVSCSIYQNRSSTCREFKASYEFGEKIESCDQARARFQLRPLTPKDWESQDSDYFAATTPL